jgi:hypothetical protein
MRNYGTDSGRYFSREGVCARLYDPISAVFRNDPEGPEQGLSRAPELSGTSLSVGGTYPGALGKRFPFRIAWNWTRDKIFNDMFSVARFELSTS